MKLLLFILLFCSSTYSQSQDKIPPDIQQKINKAKDYYDISLFAESKKILVEYGLALLIASVNFSFTIV